ncbi:uncharacterized protein LOC143003016 [Genypterus blacodes]|uniref:uncharacterized protein LOC143003016 n=1 Tax=Genypterus blacodes TaxID=154954 RepID=UPI003F758C2B
MARNEEKQHGRLNRLWLQKEREEGRLKDVQQRRPKLSTLNSAASVTKWIPSIKSDIEYYLQQSQLSHYPERKMAEFQLRMEALEREYKRFIIKLRSLDPSCKHKPWTPRAYCKRRADTQEPSSTVNKAKPCESHDGGAQLSGAQRVSEWTASDRVEDLHQSEARFQTPVSTGLVVQTSEPICSDQDRPLSFDRMRLAVAAAAFRGPSLQPGITQTQSLARVLQAGLPNLGNSAVGQSFPTRIRETAGPRGSEDEAEQKSADCETAGRRAGRSSSTETGEERTGHILGLGCYSSSEEETDT